MRMDEGVDTGRYHFRRKSGLIRHEMRQVEVYLTALQRLGAELLRKDDRSNRKWNGCLHTTG